MLQQTCNNCGAGIQDEQFCPECGQWVDGEDVFEPFSLEDGPPAGEEEVEPASTRVEAPPEIQCPSCGASNPAFNRHCEECGARLAQGPLPVAPQPAVRTTAGARALMVLAAVIMVVALAALLVNLFGGEEPGQEPSATTLAGTTTTEASVIRPLVPVDIDASSELNDAFGAANLIDEDPENSWNDASQQGDGAELTFFFGEPYQITSIVIQNLTDEVRFRRNFRIRGYEIELDDLDQTISGELQDSNQPQTIQVSSLRTTQLTIRVTSTYPAEAVEDEVPYEELALQEVKFFGRPAPSG